MYNTRIMDWELEALPELPTIIRDAIDEAGYDAPCLFSYEEDSYVS